MILLVILLESVTNLCFPQRSLGDVALEQGSKWLTFMLQISEVYPPTLTHGIFASQRRGALSLQSHSDFTACL